jgi:hypothetical protein
MLSSRLKKERLLVFPCFVPRLRETSACGLSGPKEFVLDEDSITAAVERMRQGKRAGGSELYHSRARPGRGSKRGEMKGKTALVTGSTGGVGRMVAKRLGDAGARVLVHGRNQERGERVILEIKQCAGTRELLAARFTKQAGRAGVCFWTDVSAWAGHGQDAGRRHQPVRTGDDAERMPLSLQFLRLPNFPLSLAPGSLRRHSRKAAKDIALASNGCRAGCAALIPLLLPHRRPRRASLPPMPPGRSVIAAIERAAMFAPGSADERLPRRGRDLPDPALVQHPADSLPVRRFSRTASA